MDFETIGMIAAGWFVVSIVVSPVLGLFLHESNVGVANEEKLSQTE